MRIAFMSAAMAVTLSVASSASADPPKKKNEPRRESLVAGGSAAFVLGYGYAAGMGGLEYRSPGGRAASDMFLPVAGPYLALAQNQVSIRTLASTKLADGYFRDRSGPATVGDVAVFEGGLVLFAFEYAALLADPLVQGAGLATASVAGVMQDKSLRAASAPPRPQWSVAPAWNAGPGVALSVTSW